MAEVKLTDIFDQKLTLTEDRCGCWTLEDMSGNSLFLQSDYDRQAWAEELLIINDRDAGWITLATYLKEDGLSDWTWPVRATPDAWGLAVCES